jgi:hypothetical protein
MASDYIKKHLSWQKYAKKELAAGRKPTKFKDWGGNKRTKDVKSGLAAASIDWEKDKPSARLKRSK